MKTVILLILFLAINSKVNGLKISVNYCWPSGRGQRKNILRCYKYIKLFVNKFFNKNVMLFPVFIATTVKIK